MKAYQPISCDLYDELELIALRGTRVALEWAAGPGENSFLRARILELFTKNKEEFAVLDNGRTIRLDQLRKVNGIPFPASKDRPPSTH